MTTSSTSHEIQSWPTQQLRGDPIQGSRYTSAEFFQQEWEGMWTKVWLLLGRESAGVPDGVHARADARVLIPMVGGARSLNIAIAGAMVLGEAIRQVG